MGCDAYLPSGSSKSASVMRNVSAPVMESLELFIDRPASGINADALLVSGKQAIVRAGSTVSPENRLSNQKGQEKSDALRKTLEKDGTIMDGEFTCDYEFSSPSAATTVILGSSASGNDQWKDKDGVTLGEIRKGGMT